MKIMFKGFVCAAAVMAAVAISGCASSSGYSKGGDAAKGMDKAAAEVQAIVQQTSLTLGSLSNLVNHPAPNLVPQYKEFTSATKKLTSLSESVDKKAADMRERGDAYFAEWNKGATNITNADLRKISEDRRNEVASAFAEVADSLKRSKDAFDPFLSNLRDIQQVLNLDLTQGGLRSIQSVAKTASENGQKLKGALTEAAEDIESLAGKMSSSGPAPKS